MALADLAAYDDALTASPDVPFLNLGTNAVVAARHHDLWAAQFPAGVAPTTAVVPTRATTGALGQQNPGGGGKVGLVGARVNSLAPGTYIIADRLSHQGGLSAVVTTAQTTNLPTAALTRYTTGEGVMLGLTIYAAIGGTATTVTASYTNQAGTSGRTTVPVQIGATGFNAALRLIILPLQGTDTGVRAVASVTVLATTGTAGNFGVTLFKPLAAICVRDTSALDAVDYISGGFGPGLPEVETDACLFSVAVPSTTSPAASAAIFTKEW